MKKLGLSTSDDLGNDVTAWLQQHGVQKDDHILPPTWSIVLILAAAFFSGAVVLYCVQTGWTGEEFEAADGALTGIGFSVVPATCIGLYLAFGYGSLKRRIFRGLSILLFVPLVALLISVIMTIRAKKNNNLKDENSFFATLAALIICLSSALLWTIVLRIKNSISTWAAASFASLTCVGIGIPIFIALPLILTKNNGFIYERWWQSNKAHRSPLPIVIALAFPYVTLMILLVPYIKLCILDWQIDPLVEKSSVQHFSLKALGYTTRAFKHLDLLAAYCVFSFLPSVLLNAHAPLRLAAAFLLTLTPVAALVTAKIGSWSGSIDQVWTRGTRTFLLPTIALGMLTLRVAHTVDTHQAWLLPTSVAIFGFTTIILVILLVLPCTWSAPTHFRFEISTKVLRFLLGPWWLVTLFFADAPLFFWGIIVIFAILISINTWLDTANSIFKNVFIQKSKIKKEEHFIILHIPQRRDVFTVIPHALLIFSVMYLLFNIIFVQFRIGGLGIVIVNVLMAPYVTSHGIHIMKQKGLTSNISQNAFIIIPFIILLILFIMHILSQRSASTFMNFNRSYLSEAKAGALWLLFALPLSILGWYMVMKAAEIWSAGQVHHHLNIFSASWDYYTNLLKKVSLQATESSIEIFANHDANMNSNTIWAAMRTGFDLSTIHGEEAIPSFATLLCLVLLVPFGVLAPLGFLTKFGALGLSTEIILSILGMSVILGVTVFAYACNASMERIRLEQQIKIAAFDLRLALRKARVIAAVKCARMLCESRARHYGHALQIVASEKQKTIKLLEPREQFLAARVADFALREDLLKASERYTRVLDLAKQELDDTDTPTTPRLPGEIQTPTDDKNAIMKRMRHALGDNECTHEDTCAELVAELSGEASVHDKQLVYWKPSKKETTCMTLGTLATLFAEFQQTHDREMRQIQKKYAREEKFERRKTVAAEQIDIHMKKMSVQRKSTRCGRIFIFIIEMFHYLFMIIKSTCCAYFLTRRHTEQRATTFIKVAKKKRVVPTNPKHIEYIDFVQSKLDALFRFVQESKIQDYDGSLRQMHTKLKQQVATLCNDDALEIPPELQILEKRLAAVARWQLLRASLPFIFERRYRLRIPEDKSNTIYLEGLLPRAFCHYATPLANNQNECGLSFDNWLELLDDANILNSPHPIESSHHVDYDYAKTIFKKFLKSGNDSDGKSLISYISFRQAMRHTAIALYPRLSEEAALKALGKKHIFARVLLAPSIKAVEMGLLSADKVQSRWLQIIETRFSSIFCTPDFDKFSDAIIDGRELAFKGIDAYSEQADKFISSSLNKYEQQDVAKRIGWSYGRQLLDGRQFILQFKMVYTAAAEAITQEEEQDEYDDVDDDEFDEDSAPELTAKMLALLLEGKEVDINSNDISQLRRLQDQASKEKDAQSKKRCGFIRIRGIFSLTDDKKVMGEAQMELELLKAGAEIQKQNTKTISRPSNWDDIVDLIIQNLRRSADAALNTDNTKDNKKDNQQMLRINMNIDNAFAILELITDFLSFASIAFKGASGYGWGLERSCDLSLDPCEDPSSASSQAKSTASFLASAPLMTLQYNTLGQFWFVVCLCILTPFYLLEAVNAAREQRLGKNRDGSKLNIFSISYFYLQSIKILQATMPPIMTTLVSVLVCDACSPRPKRLSRMSTPCASALHVIQLGAAFIATLCYYPAISFIQPQLQFKSTALDLKFIPSYLVVLAQGKLMLAGAVNFLAPEKYVRNCIKGDIESRVLHSSLSLLFFAASLATILAIYTLKVQPCIVRDFSIVRACSLAAAAATLWVSILAFMFRRYMVSKDAARSIGALLLFLLFAWLFGTALYYARRIFGNHRSKSSRKIVPMVEDGLTSPDLSSEIEGDKSTSKNGLRRVSSLSAMIPVSS